MHTTNLGDSGYTIYRPDGEGLQKVFRSKEQQYSFNFPYQCGTGCELPTAAFDNEHEIQHHDVVIMGTDGLFDNVFDKDMEPCILEAGRGKEFSSESAANCLGKKAYAYSKNRNYDSPFAQGAREARRRFMGGKEDDITVVVSQICQV